jgi:hypothetical protein
MLRDDPKNSPWHWLSNLQTKSSKHLDLYPTVVSRRRAIEPASWRGRLGDQGSDSNSVSGTNMGRGRVTATLYEGTSYCARVVCRRRQKM